MTQAMVMPLAAAILRQRMTSRAALESRPEVGSSRNSSDGSATSSIPMLTRFFWPPLMPRTWTVALWQKKKNSNSIV